MIAPASEPRDLVEVARECRGIAGRAVAALGADLGGGSLLDLCADQITDVSLFDLKTAIVVSGLEVDPRLSPRVQALARRYGQ